MLAFGLSAPLAAQADEIHVHYDTYAAGLHVLRTDARLDLAPTRYRLQLDYQTAGTYGFFNRAEFANRGEGVFEPGGARPTRFASDGHTHGEPRSTAIAYRNGDPVIERLLPIVDEDREPIPPELRHSAIDVLGAMAQVIHQVNQGGRCEARFRTFDGRRLSELRAWTVGYGTLPPSDRAVFSGRALHCEFEGRLLAGFKLDESRDAQAKLQHGGAWFGAVTPGGTLIPVRMTFGTPWFGEATMLLDEVH